MRLVLINFNILLPEACPKDIGSCQTHRHVRHPVLDRLENTFLLVCEAIAECYRGEIFIGYMCL